MSDFGPKRTSNWIPRGSSRLIGAFVLAPFVGLVVVEKVTGTLDILPLALIFAYPIALVFGVPVFLLFARRRWLRWWQVVLGGAACAVPFTAFYFGTANPLHIAAYGLKNSAYLLSCGAAIGLAFWALGLAGNPLFIKKGVANAATSDGASDSRP